MLILASASVRRHELLRNAGIQFRAQPADIHEERCDGEAAKGYVARLAKEKAEAVARELAKSDSDYPLAVLGADTIVVVEDQMLEKPLDAADAKRMLRLLSGKSHDVMTGVCLLLKSTKQGEPESFVAVEKTRVDFWKLTDEEIEFYVASGEPLGKAGAYAIQGIASRWIPRVEGCYFNVVGLPVSLVYQMLKRHAPHLVDIRKS